MKFVGRYWFTSGWNYFSSCHSGWRREDVRTSCHLSDWNCVWRSSSTSRWFQLHGLRHLWMVPNQMEGKHWAKLVLISLGLQSGIFSVYQKSCGEDRASLDNYKLLIVPPREMSWAELTFRSTGTWLKQNEFHLKACKISKIKNIKWRVH